MEAAPADHGGRFVVVWCFEMGVVRLVKLEIFFGRRAAKGQYGCREGRGMQSISSLKFEDFWPTEIKEGCKALK